MTVQDPILKEREGIPEDDIQYYGMMSTQAETSWDLDQLHL